MSRNLSNQFLSEILAQESSDPFLALVTISHAAWSQSYYLVNDAVDITSNGQLFTAFPFELTLPSDEADSNRRVSIVFDNVSLELIESLRAITSPAEIKIQLVLASLPDIVEIELDQLKLQAVGYDVFKVTCEIYSDEFLYTELTSEKYTPSNFPGIF